MTKFIYLSLDLTTFLLPFILSFNSRTKFSKKWRFVWPAIVVPALVFIAWDAWFTGMGVWGFNPRYLCGVHIFQLPLEEVLFFVCIPYACLFIYDTVNYFSTSEPLPDRGRRVSWVLITGFTLLAIKNYDRWYPAVTFFALALYLLFLMIKVKPPYLGRFYFAFIFILVPFLIVNGILTGTGLPEPVVWYDHTEILGIRILTIPIEDTFFGMLLILMNVTTFEYLKRR